MTSVKSPFTFIAPFAFAPESGKKGDVRKSLLPLAEFTSADLTTSGLLPSIRERFVKERTFGAFFSHPAKLWLWGRRMLSELLVSQSDHRIDFGRPSRRYVTSQNRAGPQNCTHANEGQRIGRPDAIKQVGH